MKSLGKIIALILGMLGLSSLASSKKKAAVKKIDAKKKVVKKQVKDIDKKLNVFINSSYFGYSIYIF